MQGRKAGAIALMVVAWAARACAVLLCALTVLLCFGGLSARLGLAGFVVELTQALPALIAGYGLVATPLGGVFRLDFAILAVALFVLDYVCVRASRALR